MAERRQASALRYEGGEAVPQLVASGQGLIAERILALAEEAGVPVRQDPILAQALASLQLGSDVPPQLYLAVAEALVWAWQLDQAK